MLSIAKGSLNAYDLKAIFKNNKIKIGLDELTIKFLVEFDFEGFYSLHNLLKEMILRKIPADVNKKLSLELAHYLFEKKEREPFLRLENLKESIKYFFKFNKYEFALNALLKASEEFHDFCLNEEFGGIADSLFQFINNPTFELYMLRIEFYRSKEEYDRCTELLDLMEKFNEPEQIYHIMIAKAGISLQKR